MASSNKVVVVKRGAFGVTHEAMGEVFNNRSALTSWLPANVDIVHPGTGDFLREAVDASYNEGEPLRYNTNIVIAKWLGGKTADDGVLVRIVLKQVDLDGVGWDMFAPTDNISNDDLTEIFKVRPEVLERVRVVKSLEPFCAASKAGFHIGDVLLRQRNLRTTELFLVSEAQPHVIGLGTNNDNGNGNDPELLFVVRFVPNFRGATNTNTTSLALAGIRSIESFDSDDDDGDDSTLKEKPASPPRVPFRGLRSRVSQANEILSPGSSSSWRHGWAYNTKPPPFHMFATEAKRAQFQAVGLPTKIHSVHKTRPIMAKGKSPAKRRTHRSSRSADSAGIGFDFGAATGSTDTATLFGFKTEKGIVLSIPSTKTRGSCGDTNANLGDAENVAPGETKSALVVSPSKQRIAELEAKVATLSKALASQEK